MMEG
jgi:aspartate carbamoyltransferase catalytic subunit